MRTQRARSTDGLRTHRDSTCAGIAEGLSAGESGGDCIVHGGERECVVSSGDMGASRGGGDDGPKAGEISRGVP